MNEINSRKFLTKMFHKTGFIYKITNFTKHLRIHTQQYLDIIQVLNINVLNFTYFVFLKQNC